MPSKLGDFLLCSVTLASVGCDAEEAQNPSAFVVPEQATRLESVAVEAPLGDAILVYEDEADAAMLAAVRPPDDPEHVQALLLADLPRMGTLRTEPEVSALWFVRGAGLTVQNFSDEQVLVAAYFPGEAGCRFTLARRAVDAHGSIIIRPEGEPDCEWAEASLVIIGQDGLPGRQIPVSRDPRILDEVRAP